MKYVICLLLGVLLGASVALLFAPSTGEELRVNIRHGADTQVTRVKDEWHRGVQGLQERAGKLNSEPKEPTAQSMETETIA